MSHQSWIKETIKKLERQGWSYRKNKKHIVLYPADKAKICLTISLTPSDRNAERQATRQIVSSGGRL